jgi:hypothetical protein
LDTNQVLRGIIYPNGLYWKGLKINDLTYYLKKVEKEEVVYHDKLGASSILLCE